MLQGRNENTNKLAISGLIEIFLKIVSLLEISVRVWLRKDSVQKVQQWHKWWGSFGAITHTLRKS